MSDYSKTYDGAAKDAAQSTIAGADFDTEFNAIQTAVATKANKKVPAATNNLAALDGTGDLADSGKAYPTDTIVGTSDTQTLTNKTLTSPDINGGTWNGTIDGGWTAAGQTCTNLGSVTTCDINGGTISGATIDGNLTAVAATISPTELSYLDGVTSNIQTQINNIQFPGGALVYKSGSGQSLTNSTNNAITYNSESYDTDSIHSTVSNTSRLTVPAGVTKIRLIANVYVISGAAAGEIATWFNKNGAVFVGHSYQSIPNGGQSTITASLVSPILNVTGGDYFETIVYPTGMTTPSAYFTENRNTFAMEIIE